MTEKKSHIDFGKSVHTHLFKTGDIAFCFTCGKYKPELVDCKKCKNNGEICSCNIITLNLNISDCLKK